MSRPRPSWYHSAVISPSSFSQISRRAPVTGFQTSGSWRRRRSCRASRRESPGAGAKLSPTTPMPGPSYSSPTTWPDWRTTRSAGWRKSPYSPWLIAISSPSIDMPAAQAASPCSYSILTCSPSRTRWMRNVPSLARLIAARPVDESAMPYGWPGGAPRATGWSGPPKKGWRRQMPNSSPSVSSNQ
ncbi:hypothetical protein ACFSTC_55995 [Nonomuraea ferruginea]